MAEYSPMMQHYLKTKEEYKDCILFYRLGDFYEMFFDDALLVSKALELTLTGKQCGTEEKAPMCGVPFHAADIYINRLLKLGYKVAVCEQIGDPKLSKGIVERKVIRIATPGTSTDSAVLDEKTNNFIVCVYEDEGGKYGFSAADVSTGDFYVTELDSDEKLIDEFTKYDPSEIICNEPLLSKNLFLDRLKVAAFNALDNKHFSCDHATTVLLKHFKVNSLEGLGLNELENAKISAGALLTYLYDTQMNELSHITGFTIYSTGTFMALDSATRRNLELTETLRDKNKRGSLLWVLDHTNTAMGARTLRSWLEQPCTERAAIEDRYDAISELNDKAFDREELYEYLNPVYDLERLITRITYLTANPKDLIALKGSLNAIPGIKLVLDGFKTRELYKINESIDALTDVAKLIEECVNDDPPLTVHDGGIIKPGFNSEVDRLRDISGNAKEYLARIEEEEREKTGIKNLRIKYNKVFGYFLEVTNSFKDLVPDYYIRKQTLANAERYITPDLKELEDTILGAQDKLIQLEYDLFSLLKEQISKEVLRVQKTAKALGKLDALISLAKTAEKNHYCRPVLNNSGLISIKNGRHPVVEKMLTDTEFVPNDTYLDDDDNRISVITGPNMAGKSTYMRQTAVIVLLAMIGSFVPADSADICMVDRIFTRIGASDDLASGQSTFLVEMNEVANILRNATKNSLLILDEIGRGTSTFDGLSIAWSVIEYLSDPKIIGAKTLFATHYHELTELEGKLKNVKNYCISVKEDGDDIIFLRKIIRGGADRSYGIQVARLAGVPDAVIKRAKEICKDLSDNDLAESVTAKKIASGKKKVRSNIDKNQISIFECMADEAAASNSSNNNVLEKIKSLDLTNMTPLQALNTLYELKNIIDKD